MQILLSGIDIETIAFSRQCSNGTRNAVVRLLLENGTRVRCVIGARVLLKENKIDPSKVYKLFLLDSNLQSEGQSHYIDNPRIAHDSALSGFIIDHTESIIGGNPITAKEEDRGKDTTSYVEIANDWFYKEWSPEVITGYKGTFTGIFRRIDTFLPGISNYTVTIQPLYNPGDTMVISEIGEWKKGYAHICYGDINIPINVNYIEQVSGIKFIEGNLYTFDCKFGNDEGWGYIGYPQFSEYLFLSGLITDSDFDPSK